MQSFPMLVEKLEGTVLMGSWSSVESKPLVAEYRVSEPTGILGSVGRAQRSYRSCVVEHQVCCMLTIVEITIIEIHLEKLTRVWAIRLPSRLQSSLVVGTPRVYLVSLFRPNEDRARREGVSRSRQSIETVSPRTNERDRIVKNRRSTFFISLFQPQQGASCQRGTVADTVSYCKESRTNAFDEKKIRPESLSDLSL